MFVFSILIGFFLCTNVTSGAKDPFNFDPDPGFRTRKKMGLLLFTVT